MKNTMTKTNYNFTAIYEFTNGKKKYIDINADDISTAHNIAVSKLNNGKYYGKIVNDIRVYCRIDSATAAYNAALTIVKRTTANMIQAGTGKTTSGDAIIAGYGADDMTIYAAATMQNGNGGTGTQNLRYALYSGARAVSITPNGAKCNHRDGGICNIIQDLLHTAIYELYNYADEDIETQYSMAYKAVNKYLYNNSNIGKGGKGYKTLYIEDANGDIVNVNRAINIILRGNERNEFFPTTDDESDDANLIIINNIISKCRDRQKNIIKYLSYGYSQKQIAEKLGCSQQNVAARIKDIRKIAFTLYPDGVRAAQKSAAIK